MNLFYFDASALGKRYLVEPGTQLVNLLFEQVAGTRLSMLGLGIGEVLSILVRRRNERRISAQAYQEAMQLLRVELLPPRNLLRLAVDDALIHGSLAMIEKHSLNATDALVLRSALELAAVLRARGDELVLVASDTRLLKAAAAEGLTVFDPQSDTPARLRELIEAR